MEITIDVRRDKHITRIYSEGEVKNILLNYFGVKGVTYIYTEDSAIAIFTHAWDEIHETLSSIFDIKVNYI